jgi:hypothetical protein
MYFTVGTAPVTNHNYNAPNQSSHTRKSNFVGTSSKDPDNIYHIDYDLKNLDILQEDSSTEKKNLREDNRGGSTDNRGNKGTKEQVSFLGDVKSWLEEFNKDEALGEFCKLTSIDNFMLRVSPIVNNTFSYSILKDKEVNPITLQHYTDVFLPFIGIDIGDKAYAGEHNITVADVMITLSELNESVRSSTLNLVHCDRVDSLKRYIEPGDCSLPDIISDNDYMIRHYFESFYGENKPLTITGMSNLFNKLTVAEMYALLYEINNSQFTHDNEKLTCYLYAQFAIFIALGGNIRVEQIEKIKDKHQISK